jgi:hypothetical protein
VPRKPTKAKIAEQEQYLLERQRVFRVVADRLTLALAQCPGVEAVALIGSVARPLPRDVPRFSPYRQLRLKIAHECKDLDLAAWVSQLDRLETLRRTRIRVLRDMVAERGSAPADHEIEVFLLEPGTNRYLGRLCHYRECPAEKLACLAAGCGQPRFLQQLDGFSFWPQATEHAVRLYDRTAGGIIAQAADLPLVILDADS